MCRWNKQTNRDTMECQNEGLDWFQSESVNTPFTAGGAAEVKGGWLYLIGCVSFLFWGGGLASLAYWSLGVGQVDKRRWCHDVDCDAPAPTTPHAANSIRFSSLYIFFSLSLFLSLFFCWVVCYFLVFKATHCVPPFFGVRWWRHRLVSCFFGLWISADVADSVFAW